MFYRRAITALVLLSILLFLVYLHQQKLLVAILFLSYIISVYEVFVMSSINILYCYLLLFCCMFIFIIIKYIMFYDIYLLYFVLVSLLWFLIVPYLLFSQINPSRTIILALFLTSVMCAVYALLMFYNILNALQLLYLLTIPWMSDTSAYIFGKLIGKHKIPNLVSPNKTVEGFISAILCTSVYLLILFFTNQLTFIIGNYSQLFTFIVLANTSIIIGDLFESWIKRKFNAKDSGVLLPGHGGMFDRIDSSISFLSVVCSFLILLK